MKNFTLYVDGKQVDSEGFKKALEAMEVGGSVLVSRTETPDDSDMLVTKISMTAEENPYTDDSEGWIVTNDGASIWTDVDDGFIYAEFEDTRRHNDVFITSKKAYHTIKAWWKSNW